MKDSEVKKRIEKLEQAVAELRRELSMLRTEIAAARQPVKPVVDPYPKPWGPAPSHPPYTSPTRPPWENPTVTFDGGCRVCGLKSDGPMGYVCVNPRCPTGITVSFDTQTSIAKPNPEGSADAFGHIAPSWGAA